MADHISTRSASRQTTPQSPPKSTGSRGMTPQNLPQNLPQRTTRSTRSQSRDVSDSEESRAGARTNRRRGGRQASANVEGDIDKNMRGTDLRRKPKTRTRVQRDLPTVTEDPTVVYPDLPVSAEDMNGIENGGIQRRSLHENKSPGGASVFSGTTARTSRSAQELLSLNAEDMLDTLQDLSDASDKLLRLVLPPNTSESEMNVIRSEIKNPESRLSKNFRRLCTSFQVHRDSYGNTFYIHSAAVLRTILGVKRVANIAYGPWRPDSLLQKANLCSLLMTILMAPEKAESDRAIEELEPVFPVPFLHSFVSSELVSTYAGSSALKRDTLMLGLELRTQYAILQLTRNATQLNFDPDTILFQVFYQTEERLNGWDLAGMGAEAFSLDFEDTIKHRLALIRQSFLEEPQASRTGQLVDVNRLKTEFAWDKFVNELTAWSSARLDELQRQINFVGGGAGDIKLALEKEVENVHTNSLADNGATSVDRTSPQVELIYEPPSELSHAPMETTERAGLPASTTAHLKIFSHNSPRIIPHKVNLFKKQFKNRPESYVAQEAPMVPPIVHVAGTAPPVNHLQGLSKKTNDTVVTFSAPVNRGGGLEPRIQIDDHVRTEAQSPDSERDEPAAATQIMQIHAQEEAESDNRDLARGLVHNSHQLSQREFTKPRLIDRQAGAVRLNFDSQGSTQTGSSNAHRNVMEPVELGDEEEDQDQIEDPSQDVGFQEDTRPVTVNARRNATPSNHHPVAESVTAAPRPHKRVRSSTETQSPRKRSRPIERVPEPDDDNDEDEDAIRRVTERHNRNSAGTNKPPPTQLENYKEANSSNRSRNSKQQKKVQSRKAWTDEETERLIYLIEKQGTSWALLKKIDDKKKKILLDRDQVALKDKARNMKVDYLKACVRLPQNFHKISLNKNQIQTLRSLGMEYNTDTGTVRERGLDPVESD